MPYKKYSYIHSFSLSVKFITLLNSYFTPEELQLGRKIKNFELSLGAEIYLWTRNDETQEQPL